MPVTPPLLDKSEIIPTSAELVLHFEWPMLLRHFGAHHFQFGLTTSSNHVVKQAILLKRKWKFDSDLY
jgi:hypothetical protein